MSLITLILIGCGPKVNQADEHLTKETNVTQKTPPLTRAQNTFAFKLFKKICATDATSANKLISPLSVYVDLSMLFNGAEGITQKAMAEALQLKGVSIQMLNRKHKELLEKLPQLDTAVTFDLENSMWYRADLVPSQDFLARTKEFYEADLIRADFESPATAEAMNEWVQKKTRGKITGDFKNLKPDDVLFLLNVVYFNGKWAHPFDPEQTREDLFFSPDGAGNEVPFMHAHQPYAYAEVDGMQLVKLPYGNGQFNMYVFLPPEEQSVQHVIKELNNEQFLEWTKQLKTQKIELFLPKWESSYTVNHMREELSQMGMGPAFQNQADFSRVFEDQPTKISQIKHKTYIRVDESGTEAAGFTSIGLTTTSIKMDPDPIMRVNRPFVYLITAKDKGTILFLGVVNNPAE